ncbi:Gfo/Idh/MocA family protein [Natrinema sp. HArc-T2]|uniref:Gfo/Idh/MocA family protein n=1 Tax=Natrinema sp. HArc-T2 TaxID=3242701 RepID=UPI00359CDDC9
MTTHAVIGTGYWGSNHVRVASELEEAGVLDDVVLCDIDKTRVRDLASDYGLEYVTDHSQLSDIGVDTAVIATPSTTHREIATTLLESGIDCLVEKPLALSSDDAWDIVDTASENGRTLGVGHIFRYHPALRGLERRIDRGELGQIKYLTTTRSTFRAPRATTGALYSLAVHDVDIYNMLLERTPDHLFCRLDRHVRDDIDETATLVLGYGGVTGIINESWQIPVFGKRRDLVVVGSERTAHLDYLADTELTIYDASVVREGDALRAQDEGSTTYEVEGYEPLRQEIEDFLTASCEGRDPLADGEIGAKTVELLERAEESAERNETIEL